MVAIIMTVIVATAIFLMNHTGDCLIVRNGKTGEILARYPLAEGGEFSVGFIHSVNQSPVIDYYRITDGDIMVYETEYYNFGAGVQTTLNEGEYLKQGEDGSMIISGIDKIIGELSYVVSPVYDHVLKIGTKEVSLKELCGEDRLIILQYEQ